MLRSEEGCFREEGGQYHVKLAIPFVTVTSHRGNSHFLRHKRGLNKVPSY